MPTNPSAQARAEAASAPLGTAELAIAICEQLACGDILFAAADEARATATAASLTAAAPEATIIFCPSSDALPGDAAPASPANVGRRVAALRQVRAAQLQARTGPIALITTGEALARSYAPPSAFDAEPPVVREGDKLDLTDLFDRLLAVGYIEDDRVDEPGEVALRGAVLDVFPADAHQPVRIEVIDGEVASLRGYDAATQRTTETLAVQQLGRVSEPEPGESPVALLDHLPNARLAFDSGAEQRRVRFLQLAKDAAGRQPGRAAKDIIGDRDWHAAAHCRETIELTRAGDPPDRYVEARSPMRRLNQALRDAAEAGDRVALLGSERDLRYLTRRIAKSAKITAQPIDHWSAVKDAAQGSLLALTMPADRGFRRPGVLAIAAADLLGSRAERDETGPLAGSAHLFALGEIRVGDVVVHEDYGVAQVAGLEQLILSDGENGGDAIKLLHAGGTVRLVPVAEADRLWRYGAEAEAVTLDKLDASSWAKRRADLEAALAETARGLTALAAARAEATAPALTPDAAAYERFANGFPFSETPDQAKAIDAVRADLASGKPMDRLVIGDVGFGKTEVALRAAAVAVFSGKQVAIAAPTTVLARQHLETFGQRFADSGMAVAGLSRLSSAAERKRVREGLADGSIRIVVGTGAVAAKGIAYQDLGLIVIDEEQRFGAADKQRMRDLSSGHVLTLSATPIPRTLQSALVGLQQLSVIATPPARRQPIRTLVSSFDDDVVRAALLREKSRGGQSFVVVPRIEDMAGLAERLAKLVPELAIRQAHGKMAAAEIDEAMVGFANGDGDVLLATNIIETGLDVPRANTMLVWRADRFGLSQLHQLRGRVGRGSRRGHIFLFTEAGREIAPRTLKRLRTLEAFDQLGAGFAISARDLDLRGAGDLLGEEQAGHLRLVGVDLYQRLLEDALRRARGEAIETWKPELRVGAVGHLPEDWIPDPDIRITLYARLARIGDEAALDDLSEELEDRFGALPMPAQILLDIARLRLAATRAEVSRIVAGPAATAFEFREGRVPQGIAGLEQSNERWLLRERFDSSEARLERIAPIVSELGEQTQAVQD